LGGWVLGLGPTPPIPNPQSPIPNPQSPKETFKIFIYIYNAYK